VPVGRAKRATRASVATIVEAATAHRSLDSASVPVATATTVLHAYSASAHLFTTCPKK